VCSIAATTAWPGTRRAGTTWAPQCKQKARFSKGDAEKAIAATTYQANDYTVLLSCEATRAVRDVFAAQPGWDVWDVRDISAKVRAMPLAVACRGWLAYPRSLRHALRRVLIRVVQSAEH
jgi:hypothetical protein